MRAIASLFSDDVTCYVYLAKFSLISTLPPELSKPPDGTTFKSLWELTQSLPFKLAHDLYKYRFFLKLTITLAVLDSLNKSPLTENTSGKF